MTRSAEEVLQRQDRNRAIEWYGRFTLGLFTAMNVTALALSAIALSENDTPGSAAPFLGVMGSSILIVKELAEYSDRFKRLNYQFHDRNIQLLNGICAIAVGVFGLAFNPRGPLSSCMCISLMLRALTPYNTLISICQPIVKCSGFAAVKQTLQTECFGHTLD